MTEFMKGPQWASEEARSVWEHKIAVARNLYDQLEAISLSVGIRDSALYVASPEQLVEISQGGSLQGLEATVLATQPLGEGYSSATPSSGRQGFRVALHKPGLALAWHEAWTGNDDKAIGELLGFPPCCIEFFEKVWVNDRRRDTTPSMKNLNGPAESNILLRWLGVRLVPHLPCSADCAATTELAGQYMEAAKKANLLYQLNCALEVLSLPMTYSALNGIGIIQTPHFRFSFSTEWCPEELRLEREALPFEAETEAIAPEPTVWQDNGFDNRTAMVFSHDTIEVVVRKKPDNKKFADLGCGDGTLLNKLRMSGAIVDGWGCEKDPAKVLRGQRRYPDIELVTSPIEDVTEFKFDTVLLMPGRLVEMGPEKAQRVKEDLFEQAGRVIAYSYDGKLHELASRVGLELAPDVVAAGSTAAAEVIGWT